MLYSPLPNRFATAALAILATAAISPANMITNGSFELGTFVNQGNVTDVLPSGSAAMTGWTVSQDQLAWIGAGNPWGISAQEGDRYLDLTGYSAGAPFGGVSQTVATVPGANYVLTFYLGSYTSRWGGPPVSMTASAGTTSGTFSNPNATTNSTWTLYAMPLVADASSTTVSLTGTAGSNYIGLDNVSLDLVSSEPAEVPEPDSVNLALCAAALLLSARLLGRACL